MNRTLGTCPAPVLRGIIDDAHLDDMRLRNEARAQQAIARLGSRYCCHPANAPRPRTQQPHDSH